METISDLLEKRRISRIRFSKQVKLVEQLKDEVDAMKEDGSEREKRKATFTVRQAFGELQEVHNILVSLQAEIDYHPNYDSYSTTLSVARQKEEEEKEAKYKVTFFKTAAEVEDLEKENSQVEDDAKSSRSSEISMHDISRSITTGLKEAFQDMNFGVSPEQLSQLLSASSSKRKQISVPKFLGDEEMFEMWVGMVRKEMEKSGWSGDEEKAYFVFSCLDGRAKKKCLGLKNPKPEDILKYLEAEYGNVELKIEKAISKISDMKAIQYSVEEIDNMYTDLLAQWNYIVQKHPHPESLKKESWILTALAKPKLPEEIIREWETAKKRKMGLEDRSQSSKFPEDFDIFLCNLYDAYEVAVKTKRMKQVQEKRPEEGGKKPLPRNWKPTGQALTSEMQVNRICIFCKKSHESRNCFIAPKMNHQEKYACIMQQEACLNCLQQANHFASSCPMTGQCKLCTRKHHTLLHMTSGTKSSSNKIPTNATDVECDDGTIASDDREVLPETDAEDQEAQEEQMHLVRCVSSKGAILQSAVVFAESKNGKLPARILFDQGSGTSLMKKSLAKKLGLTGKRTSCTFTLVGGKTFTQNCMKVKFLISSVIPNWIGETFEIEAYVIDEPCSDLRAVICEVSAMPHLKNLQLTEKFPHESLSVEIILGIEDCMRVLLPQRIDGPDGFPGAQLSHVGWVVFGSNPQQLLQENGDAMDIQHSMFVDVYEDTVIERLWELDSLGIQPNEGKSDKRSFLEEEALRQHRQSMLNIGGRYETCLITHPDYANNVIPNNKAQASRRFHNLEKRMNSNPDLAAVVHKQVSELIDKGRAELVEERTEPEHQTWYLPMSVVTKEESTTTKHRVVFDGSAKNKDGVSLNDTLLPGPATQPDMLAVWTRFRTHPVILIADIEKMFLQIKIKKEDQDRQRFFYKPTNQESVQTYRLTGVTFGLAPSPFSSIQTVLDHVESQKEKSPWAAEEICENIYVDDILTGGRNVEEVAKLASEMKDIMETGGFPLRKFLSNKPEAIAHLEREDLAEFHIEDYDPDEFTTKSLGIRIHPESDKIIYAYSDRILQVEGDETRRTLVTQLMRIHDVLGLLAPVTVRGKQLLQLSFLDRNGWDDPLSPQVAPEWIKWKDEIGTMRIQIDRCVLPEVTDAEIEIHGFSDACPSSYGTAVYLKVQDRHTGNTKVSLLAAKTRVSPLKAKRTLPELELLGALIMVRLVSFVVNSLYRLQIDSVYCWTDSQIVLHWISQPAYCWTTFIANRVSEIQKLSHPASWKFVPGKLNPADLCSRGCSVKRLESDKPWWNGPSFLQGDQADWPAQPDISDNTLRTAETKRKKLSLPLLVQTADAPTHDDELKDYADRFEKYHRFLAVMVLCRQWVRRYKAGANQDVDDLIGVKYFREEEKFWTKWAQRGSFSEEIDSLNKHLPVSAKSKLRNLDPILDDSGILRVGGRVHLSLMPDQVKHPIVLPSHNSFVEKLVMFYHVAHSHSGIAQTWANLQHKFWIVRGKQEIKRIIRKCSQCRAKKTMHQRMAQLPLERITPADCFSKIGVDFAGPLYVVEGNESVKVWVCLFVDMVARGLHLELCREPSAKGFIMALERMANRRGRPSLIYSDNAKAFKKAHSFLVNLFKNTSSKELFDQLRRKGIEWKFITSNAPWHGGFYERFVQSVKVPLRKVLGNSRLTYVELDTTLTAIEAQVNSRPLTTVSSDKEDPLPLTPAHLMMGRNLLLLPEATTDHTDFGKRWRFRQAINQKWWNRWIKEYFPKLRTFPKWTTAADNPKEGQLVHVLDYKMSKASWKLGRIVQIHPGRDDLVRSVTLMVNGKLMRRPVQKLALLEV